MRLLYALLAASVVSAYDIPANLQALYDKHKTKCKNVVSSGYSDGGNGNSMVYCGDIKNAVFLVQKNGKGYADMDVDCDGANNSGGACANDPTGQDITAFQDKVKKFGIKDLDANIHPYVVFGNKGFDPEKKLGLPPLSVMAIVCNNQLLYGIWGDTNGNKDTGEASVALAQMCFPDDGLDGDNGHTDNDVMYIGFLREDAVPGSSADWKADNSEDFEDSIADLGSRLVAGLS